VELGLPLEPVVSSCVDAQSSTREASESRSDEYLLLGGGLQSGLIALALLEQRPDTRLLLIEREPELGGNHTWCFHAGDVPAQARPWLDQLVVESWACHDVCFPRHRRRLQQGYHAVTSARLHEVVSERVQRAPHARLLRASVRAAEPGRVTLDDGSRRHAELVIDARGPTRNPATGAQAVQKFLGLELQVAPGSVPEFPVLMDATVEQIDGFRFVYLLPWAADRVLLEDTYYSTNVDLDRPAIARRILDYAEQRGMAVQRVLREESGVLPLPLRSEVPSATQGLVQAGYAGGLFHPTTGYSLPVAVRFALHIASRPALAALGADYADWIERHRRQVRYAVWLNRLLFEAFAPEQRRHVLERFYRLPAATIGRFYALETTPLDRARILCGRPPTGFSLSRLLAGGPPA
jgi:lycopene beta-cyclase